MENISCGGEGSNYLQKKNIFCLDKKTTEKEKDQLFGKRYWFVEKKNREGKYFEKENILFEGNEEQIKKRRKILEGKKYCGMGEHRRLYEMRGPKNNIKIAFCQPPS